MFTTASYGAPWTDQQWLAHLTYYAAWRAFGYPAYAVLSALLVATGFAILAIAMLRRGVAPWRMFAWTTAALVVTMAGYQIEAQSFGYPLFALTLLLLTEDAAAKRPLARTWLVIPALALWANLHGSVLLGAGLAVCYALYRTVRGGRTYVLFGLAAAAAVFCTPYGFAVLGYYRQLVGNPVLARYIARWAPPNPGSPGTWAFYALVAAVLAAVLLAWRRGARPDPVLGGIALILLVLALTAARNEEWFAIGGSLLAADALAKAGRERTAALGRRFTIAVTGLLSALALTGMAALAVEPATQFELQVPHGAASAAASMAQRDPHLRILGDVYTGTSMLWLHPATAGQVGFDVRLEQYPPAQLRAYFDYVFVNGPHWDRVTGGYQILVISRGDRALVRAVSRLPGWRLAYSDNHGVVYRRA